MSSALWFRTISPKLYEIAGPRFISATRLLSSAYSPCWQRMKRSGNPSHATPACHQALVEHRSKYAHAPFSGMALAKFSGDHSMKAIAEMFGCIMRRSTGSSKHMNEIMVNDWLADIQSHELYTKNVGLQDLILLFTKASAVEDLPNSQ